MRFGRGMTLTNGNALAGRLAKSAFDLNIPLWLSSPVRELIVEDGAVRGATSSATASRCALPPDAGWCWPAAAFRTTSIRRKAMFPHAPTGAEHFSPGPTGNTGDGLRMAEAAGGRVEDSLPNAAAWVPVSVTTRKDGSKGVMPHFIDRAKPGVIAVMRDGTRFANEGNSYHDFVQEMMKAAKPGEEIRRTCCAITARCENMDSDACRRFRCRSGIIWRPAISSAARRWPNSLVMPGSTPGDLRRRSKNSTRPPPTGTTPPSARDRGL